MKSLIIYGNISPNVVDGSSVWLASIAEVATLTGSKVHLQLKERLLNHNVMARLEGLANLTIHEPSDLDSPLTPQTAVPQIKALISSESAGLVICRGLEQNYECAKDKDIATVLWAYLTDVPFPPTRISKTNLNRLSQVAKNARKVLVQTESARSYLEELVPIAAGKTLVIPPMVPEEVFLKSHSPKVSHEGPLKLVYAGKLARDWKTLEMLLLPDELEKLGILSQLTVVGSKVNSDRRFPDWACEMKDALARIERSQDDRFRLLGSVPRNMAFEAISQSDIGIGWRSSNLESSLELSTKTIEYSALGIPALTNRSSGTAELFPKDYPLFVDGRATARDAAKIISNAIEQGLPRSEDLRASVTGYSMKEAGARLTKYLNRYWPQSCEIIEFGDVPSSRPLKLVVVSHDFKFMGEVLQSLKNDNRFEIRIDHWDSLREHDQARSKKLANWCDIAFCEFAGPFLNYYFEKLGASQKLITRIHGFEIRNGNWLSSEILNSLSKVVFVSDHYRKAAIKKFQISEDRTTVIPNCIDALDLARPKLSGAEYHIGILGIVPFLKRPDRAVELLQYLLNQDSRYFLHIKGAPPWDYKYVWNDPKEKQPYLNFYGEINKDPDLRKHVIFEAFGPQVSNWFRKIGFILSPSSNESFHLAPAEGMASGCIPIIWDREGASQIFPSGAVVKDAEEGASRILNIVNKNRVEIERKQARTWANRWELSEVIPQWENLFIAATESRSLEK